MNTKQLKEIVDNGGRVIVKFNNLEIGDYSFLEVGMMAKIISIKWSPNDGSWVVHFDISEFDAYNLPLQSRDYYDENNNPTLTAREAGQWGDIEKLFIDDDFSYYFDIVTNDLLMDYIDSKVEIGYVEWLENTVNGCLARN